jgi:putative YpdA family bacillithiol system oxidoreductase
MPPETIITLGSALILVIAVVLPYYRRVRRREADAHQRFEHAKVSGAHIAATMHPHIDLLACIGCGGCVAACPEGDVLGVIGGKAVLVHGSKCVGHALCADACPVGAITLKMASPGRSANLPVLTPALETTVPGVFIAGELGGLGLIRNAFVQGRTVVEQIATRKRVAGGAFDVVIVGAGPAGIAAGLTAHHLGLRYAILEQGTVGGSILHYPRRKLVLTSPAELPLWGTLKAREIAKEELLALFDRVIRQTKLGIRENSKVIDISRTDEGLRIATQQETLTAGNVVLALGRHGTPRRLGVPGEEHPKVMYRLIDAESYTGRRILVVGGGDSAVEAAVGLAFRGKNRVTLSYRQAEFARIKERNRRHLEEQTSARRLRVMLLSTVLAIQPENVLLQTTAGDQAVPNDEVFIFAGGEMPFDFLGRIGIQFHAQDVG